MSISENADHLIKMGYDKDVIATTLGISTEQLESIQKEIEQGISKGFSTSRPKTKLQALRERYWSLYNTGYLETSTTSKTITAAQRTEVIKRLDAVEKIMSDFFQKSKEEQKSRFNELTEYYNYFEKKMLPTDLAGRTYELLQVDNLPKVKDFKTMKSMQALAKKYRSKYFSSISHEIELTEDLEELSALSGKLSKLSDIPYMQMSIARTKLANKIHSIKAKTNTQFNLSDESILSMISSLINPDIDIERLNEVIREKGIEYKERRDKIAQETGNSQSTSYGVQKMSLDVSIKQVKQQMLTLIKDKSIEIDDMDFLYQRLLALGFNEGAAARAIIDNLIQCERFDDARKLVSNFFAGRTDKADLTSKKSYQHQIQNAQIRYFIFRGINAPKGSIGDEDRYYQWIATGIEKAQINPRSLVIGSSKDGKRNIYWADIMEKQITKEKRDFTD